DQNKICDALASPDQNKICDALASPDQNKICDALASPDQTRSAPLWRCPIKREAATPRRQNLDWRQNL
ncbi:MAG: hypothetical protein ACK5JM_07265, partial [Rhodoblastus sp.]